MSPPTDFRPLQCVQREIISRSKGPELFLPSPSSLTKESHHIQNMTSISRSEAMRRGWETRRRNKAERLALEAQQRALPNTSPAAAAAVEDVSCLDPQAGMSLSQHRYSLLLCDLAVRSSQSRPSPRRTPPPGPHKLQTIRFPPRYVYPLLSPNRCRFCLP